ncbi:hypothetical protein C4572_00865 [Candidatus Parcubacteria bacterium]|nr:MAG: hypothetical protein C4572_00865 [Candidatus Parcubacteria bacterium]
MIELINQVLFKKMLKFIKLNLTKIKYAGNSVGRDIRVEIEAFGKFFRVDKRIKAGEAKSIDQEILRLESDQDVLQSDLAIAVIEKDLLFSDTGALKSSIKIDVASEKSQIFRFNVEVKESRSLLSKLFWGGRKAVFELEFEAIIGDVERYIPNTKDGWFLTLDNKDDNASLPEYLKLILRYEKGGRESGLVSAGCISIAETERWMEIYRTLIKARKGDNRSVGVLKVVD